VRLGYFRLSWLGLYSDNGLWRLRLFSFCGFGLALAALALVGFGAYDHYPEYPEKHSVTLVKNEDFLRGCRPLLLCVLLF